jgi:hypothetical protein
MTARPVGPDRTVPPPNRSTNVPAGDEHHSTLESDLPALALRTRSAA